MFDTPLQPEQASFSRGEVSPELFGRVDLQAYSSALRTSRNGFIRTEGCWSNRQGFQYVGPSTVQTLFGSVVIPFVYSNQQAYVIEIGAGAGNVQAYALGAPVGAALNSPYSLSELGQLRYTQSTDTLTVFHKNHIPYELKRTAPTTFTFLPAVYINGPFLTQNTDGTTFVYASAITGTVNLASNAAIFNANHVGALFQLSEQDLSVIPPWEPGKVNPGLPGIAGPPGTQGALRRSNGKNYKRVADYAGVNCQTGSWQPSHTQGTQPDGDGDIQPGGSATAGIYWQYQDSGFGVVLITAYIDAFHVTGVVQPNYVGGPARLPLAVVGGPTTLFGPFNFTGDGVSPGFSPLVATTSTDPNKFYVTVAGVYVAPSMYTITGLAPGTITFVIPPANGAAVVVKQIDALKQTTYWAFGAFSTDQGYPAAGTYYPDRLVMGGTIKQPVGLFGSKTSQYHDFGVSNPLVNSDGFTVFLNARQQNAINDMLPLQDLIVSTSGVMWKLFPGSTGTALGPLSISAVPQGFVGQQEGCRAVLYSDSLIYPTYGGRRLRDMIYQFQFDKYMGSELTAYSRHLIPYGKTLIELTYANEPWTQLFALRSDGVLLTCTYVRDQQMVAWSRWDTQGTIEGVAVIPENNSYALYAVIGRTINGAYTRYIERLNQWETLTDLDWRFMDASITYDGRNTSATTMILAGGTSWSAGDTGTLLASSASGWAGFAASDVTNNNVIQFYDAAGTLLGRVQITGYISPTQATVRMMGVIPTTLRGVATSVWTFARTNFTGATHLKNTLVAVLADGDALAGKDGVPYLRVDGSGNLAIPNAAGVVTIGLQYLSDFETLQLNVQGQETVRERTKDIPVLYLDVTETRGLLAGTSFDSLTSFAERGFETYTQPTNPQEGIIATQIFSDFDSETHVCVRQPYPLPATIRMVIPTVEVGQPVG